MTVNQNWSRRAFIQFVSGVSVTSMLPSSLSARTKTHESIKPILPTSEDKVILAHGLEYELLISWGETINNQNEKFGFNNDYLDFISVNNDPNDYLLWVNHESTAYGYFLTPDKPEEKSRTDVEKEARDVGGSILRMRKIEGKWQIIKNDPLNRRIDALTEIPLIADAPILGTTTALGTFGNCAGGRTPWNTFLSCEENYHYYTGEVDLSGDSRRYSKNPTVGWERFFDMPPEHYGWVVEIDPFTAEAKKHTSIGRFAHESATVVVAKDKRCVVYSGDDKTDECIYKFIADKPGSLKTGTLYVADTDNGKWLPLDIDKNPKLKGRFSSQLDLLIRTREAAKLVGGTPQDRPEDIERDPVSGAVFVTLTKNKKAGRHFGSILKIEEKDNDPLALSFKPSTFLTGGEQTGFACPDNLAFDKQGNLWFTSDISGDQLNLSPYTPFKNNGLFFVPMSGLDAGKVFQLGSAPVHAEFTGICFSDDGRSLFVSVQHPGEESKDRENLDSHWPDGGNNLPRPSVVVINGDFLNTHSALKT